MDLGPVRNRVGDPQSGTHLAVGSGCFHGGRIQRFVPEGGIAKHIIIAQPQIDHQIGKLNFILDVSSSLIWVFRIIIDVGVIPFWVIDIKQFEIMGFVLESGFDLIPASQLPNQIPAQVIGLAVAVDVGWRITQGVEFMTTSGHGVKLIFIPGAIIATVFPGGLVINENSQAIGLLEAGDA